MGAIIGGLAVAAIGAGVSAAGTAKNAKAAKNAAKASQKAEEQLYGRQSGILDTLTQSKTDKLSNLGDIFSRMESTGAFGDTNTLNNLRKAQSDFSSLAAGDFTGFESQLRKSMNDALVNTVGSGSPIGAYAGLAADTQMNYRQQGLQNAMGVSEFLSNESYKLLGSEFGIMDQNFEKGYELDRNRVTGGNQYRQQAAATEGVGMQAWGTGISQLGSGIAGYGSYMNNMDYQNRALEAGMNSVNRMNAPRAYNSGATYGNFPTAGSYSSPVGLPTTDVPGTILPSDPAYSSFGEPSPFSYGSGYQRPTYAPSTSYDGGVLPPLTSNSALSQVGRNIVAS